MQFHLLASGSRGNCFVLQQDEDIIVIDCGSTKKHLTHSFHRIGIDYENIKAVLLTHQHTDHISQLKLFQSRPIFAPFLLAESYRQVDVIPYEDFMIGDFRILPIPLSHDSEITVGYVISSREEKLVYITDTGYIRKQDHKWLRNADYYIFESNHDVELLMKTRRPYLVKQRILSVAGHLSNEASAEILSEVIGERTREIVLAHISQEANTYEKAEAACRERLAEKSILIRSARQFEILTGGLIDEYE